VAIGKPGTRELRDISRQPGHAPPLGQRAHIVPFDQLIWLPSGLNRPTTNCHSGAMIWSGACRWPYEVLPVSLVSVRKTPVLPVAIEACFDGSPCAHQVPRN